MRTLRSTPLFPLPQGFPDSRSLGFKNVAYFTGGRSRVRVRRGRRQTNRAQSGRIVLGNQTSDLQSTDFPSDAGPSLSPCPFTIFISPSGGSVSFPGQTAGLP